MNWESLNSGVPKKKKELGQLSESLISDVPKKKKNLGELGDKPMRAISSVVYASPILVSATYKDHWYYHASCSSKNKFHDKNEFIKEPGPWSMEDIFSR